MRFLGLIKTYMLIYKCTMLVYLFQQVHLELVIIGQKKPLDSRGEKQQRNSQICIIQVRLPTWKFATMLKPSAANTPNTKATLFVLGNVVAVSCDDQKVSSCLYLRHTVIKTETTNIVHAYYTRYFYAPFILKLLLQFKKYCFLKDGKIFKCLSFSNLYLLRTVKYIF